jgi:hypothetical protein
MRGWRRGAGSEWDCCPKAAGDSRQAPKSRRGIQGRPHAAPWRFKAAPGSAMGDLRWPRKPQGDSRQAPCSALGDSRQAPGGPEEHLKRRPWGIQGRPPAAPWGFKAGPQKPHGDSRRPPKAAWGFKAAPSSAMGDSRQAPGGPEEHLRGRPAAPWSI